MNDLSIERGLLAHAHDVVEAVRHEDAEKTIERVALRDIGRRFHHPELVGTTHRAEPHRWQLEKGERLPPFVSAMLGLPLQPTRNYDIMPESKTWSCTPEPLTTFVTWDAGGTDVFYALSNQSFNAFRWTNPNTGESKARFNYNAQLIASGKARSVGDLTGRLSFDIAVRNSSGAPFLFSSNTFWVSCGDNELVSWGTYFDPGLYDLIAGATWSISGIGRVLRC